MVKKIVILLAIILLISIAGRRVSPTPSKPVDRVWTIKDSKAYARDAMTAWADKQFKCLDKLWSKESHWRPNAYNKVKVMGKNAGGIPQLLGLSTKLPAPIQIDRGLEYIKYRYTTPCKALYFHDARGWY